VSVQFDNILAKMAQNELKLKLMKCIVSSIKKDCCDNQLKLEAAAFIVNSLTIFNITLNRHQALRICSIKCRVPINTHSEQTLVVLRSTFKQLPDGTCNNFMAHRPNELIEQGLTSARTQYRLYGRRFLQV